jgi:alkylhydroperoxidase family enzyme
MTDYATANPAVQAEYDDQIAKHGRITNMKRTMLRDIPTFKAYMEWYTLYDRLTAFLDSRAVSVFAYAISEANTCLVCTTFFRKILADAGDDPDNLALNGTEQLLLDFGAAIAKAPNDISEELYARIAERFDEDQRVLLIGFAGLMAATNLFNNVARVDLDEALYNYRKGE